MESMFNPADRDAIALRLAELEPNATRQWGKMDPAQMLRHCAVGLESAMALPSPNCRKETQEPGWPR